MIMAGKILGLVAITVLLSTILVMSMPSEQYAEAKTPKKAKHKFSNFVGNQVCGDELCSGPVYYKWHQKYRTYASPYDHYEHHELLKISNNR